MQMKKVFRLMRDNQESTPFGVLCLFLTIAFLTGGGSSGDILSLAVLRPTSVLIAAFGIAGLKAGNLRANRIALIMLGLVVGLALCHLLPLPPQIWQALPGREIVVSIDRAAGIEQQWRPLTLDPNGTQNALWALMVPAASMTLALRVEGTQRFWLLTFLLGAVVASACLAAFQGVSDPSGPAYLYQVTNNGSLVGLFANRNHQALLLAMAFPMLALWLSLFTKRFAKAVDRRAVGAMLVTLAIAGMLLLLILVTGSRAGVFLGLLGLLAAGLIGVHARRTNGAGLRFKQAGPNWSRWLQLSLILCAALLIGLAVALDRDLAFDRLANRSTVDEMRFLLLPTVFSMIRLYGLLGSGLGSFAAVYRIHEPDELLGPAIVNHAHNDWLELAMTGGIPALLIVLFGAIAALHRMVSLARTWNAPSERDRFALLGLILIILSAVASTGDYPLRIPSLEAVFAIAMVWAFAGSKCNEPQVQEA